jgi:hypothetical protein
MTVGLTQDEYLANSPVSLTYKPRAQPTAVGRSSPDLVAAARRPAYRLRPTL